LFEKEKIEFQREVKVGRYFIDFLLPGKIALEIAAKDARKDSKLRESGYEVVRIKWYNPVSEIARKALYSQIDELKTKLL
jgi:very-short-patch-repair endonuclease